MKFYIPDVVIDAAIKLRFWYMIWVAEWFKKSFQLRHRQVSENVVVLPAECMIFNGKKGIQLPPI